MLRGCFSPLQNIIDCLLAFYNLARCPAIRAAALLAIAYRAAGNIYNQWEIQSPTGMAATTFDGASPLLNKVFRNINKVRVKLLVP